jgi:hypothetical protein
VQEAARSKGIQLADVRAAAEDEFETAPPSFNSTPARSSLATTLSSPAGASSSWRRHHAMPFRRSISGASSPLPVA